METLTRNEAVKLLQAKGGKKKGYMAFYNYIKINKDKGVWTKEYDEFVIDKDPFLAYVESYMPRRLRRRLKREKLAERKENNHFGRYAFDKLTHLSVSILTSNAKRNNTTMGELIPEIINKYIEDKVSETVEL